MYEPAYYRRQAERARQLSQRSILDKEVAEALAVAARDYDEIVEDLESGAVEIRHPDLMPQDVSGRAQPAS